MLKHLITLLLLLLCCSALNAQEIIKGTVIHKGDKQPMVGAEVTVKGTTISTVTDVDGRFAIEVPADTRKLEVTYVGMAKASVIIKEGEEPVVVMQPFERKFMPFISLAPVVDGLTYGYNGLLIGFGAVVGAGVTCNFSRTFAITPSLELGYTRLGLDDKHNNRFYQQPFFVQVPVMFEVGKWLKNKVKLVVSAGPYVLSTLSESYSEDDNDYKYDAPDRSKDYARSSLEAGFRAGYKMIWLRYILSLYAQIGLTDAFKSLPNGDEGKNRQFGISFGYRF